MDDTTVVIRAYQKEDKEMVRRIAVDTSFFGDSGEVYLPDREVLGDMLTAYYLDYEPESAFVAESDDKVIGYLMGCLDTAREQQITGKKIISGVIWKGLRRGLLFKANTIRFVFSSIRSLIRGEFRRPDFSKEYPAHLHINISRSFRGRGIGTRLIQAFLLKLAGKKVKGVCAWTFTDGGKKLFERTGFNLVFSRQVTYFDYLLHKVVMLDCWGKKF